MRKGWGGYQIPPPSTIIKKPTLLWPLDWIISGAKYSGVPHSVQVRSKPNTGFTNYICDTNIIKRKNTLKKNEWFNLKFLFGNDWSLDFQDQFLNLWFYFHWNKIEGKRLFIVVKLIYFNSQVNSLITLSFISISHISLSLFPLFLNSLSLISPTFDPLSLSYLPVSYPQYLSSPSLFSLSLISSSHIYMSLISLSLSYMSLIALSLISPSLISLSLISLSLISLSLISLSFFSPFPPLN